MNCKFKHKYHILSIFLILFPACKNINTCKPNKKISFNQDTAFKFIKKQIEFGPRTPNSDAHQNCANFLVEKLKNYGANIIIQKATVNKYDQTPLHINNIIAEFYPEKKRRILLFAHYDSRFFADLEIHAQEQNKPIQGANDGASGVAILLEIARQIKKKQPKIGIDIIFFDAEDQGQPLYQNIYDEKSWCLGSQYWAKNIHRKKYNPIFGIGIDMVGAKNAVFHKEDNSRYYNNFLMKKIWKIAKELNYQEYFQNELSAPILHDHVFISKIAKIRSIMILENKKNKKIPFFDNWHTHNDIIQNIDKKTLKVVGEVITNTIYCTE